MCYCCRPHVEAFAPVVACAAFYLGRDRIFRVASMTIVLLHAGIGLSMNGAGLLSAFGVRGVALRRTSTPSKGRKQSSYRDWCGVFLIVLFSLGQ